MPKPPRDQPLPQVEPQPPAKGAHKAAPPAHSEIASWLESRVLRLAEEWAAEIRVRGMGHATVVDEVVARQVLQLTSMLPWLLGRHAVHLQALWARACELFGTVAAKRGLAAGEVIEEFQILRSLVIRDLYQDPLVGGAPTLREALRLNGLVDRGVTHASVGHTDAMFFQLLGDADVPAMTADQIVLEADVQLALIREELESVIGPGETLPDAVVKGWSSTPSGADA